jgi:hypothetical protein
MTNVAYILVLESFKALAIADTVFQQLLDSYPVYVGRFNAVFGLCATTPGAFLGGMNMGDEARI